MNLDEATEIQLAVFNRLTDFGAAQSIYRTIQNENLIFGLINCLMGIKQLKFDSRISYRNIKEHLNIICLYISKL